LFRTFWFTQAKIREIEFVLEVVAMAWAPKSSFAKQRKQERERWRGSSRERGYTWQWEKARAAWLAEHPLCVECEREGRAVAATVVDHRIPHRGNQELFWASETNWQSLCASHHGSKTGRGQ
jgi:5-methylcytosine-specific restriction protein A